MKRALGLWVGALVAGLALVPAATASTTYYAKPTGGATSGSCTQGAPCTFAFAYSKLGSGDTLKLLPGKYDVPALGSTCSNVTETSGVILTNETLEGIPGRPRPTLDLSKCQQIAAETGGVVRDVSVIEPSSDSGSPGLPVTASDGGILDGVVDPGGFGPFVFGAGTIENSFISGITFMGSGGVAINDTANIIQVEGQSANGLTQDAAATVVNSIASKFKAFSVNFENTDPPTTTATMTLSYYAGDTDASAPDGHGQFGTAGGTINQSHQVAPASTPLNLASDGVHETVNSPTINAGTLSSNPPLPTDDFDGGSRASGTPDVGADEAGSGLPALNTLAATGITAHGATIHGTINTNEVDNPNVRFLYGKGASRTLHSPAHDVPAGVSNVAQQVTLTGLTPGTTYTFVLVSGSQQAQVLSFRTRPLNPFKGVVFEQHTTTANAKHVVALQMFCPTSTIGFCKGILTLTRGTTKLGSAGFLADHGHLFTVHVTLTAAAFRQLVTKRTESAIGTAAAHDANNNRKTTSASITLKAPPK
ncbi:MAG: hypothetical protein ACJ764_11310 [Solirubrobacteraceae bacterium]